MTREFVLEKATKNTYFYTQVLSNDMAEPDLNMGIYVFKTALPTKPQRIRVTIEEVTS